MNPMTKIGTVLIVTLSFLCFVEGLICNVCEKSQNSRCLKGQGRCLAPRGGSCSTISYFYGSNHVLSRQGCMNPCKEKQHSHGKRLTYIMCCEKNLCNSF